MEAMNPLGAAAAAAEVLRPMVVEAELEAEAKQFVQAEVAEPIVVVAGILVEAVEPMVVVFGVFDGTVESMVVEAENLFETEESKAPGAVVALVLGAEPKVAVLAEAVPVAEPKVADFVAVTAVVPEAGPRVPGFAAGTADSLEAVANAAEHGIGVALALEVGTIVAGLAVEQV
jgi:hypothetical protein